MELTECGRTNVALLKCGVKFGEEAPNWNELVGSLSHASKIVLNTKKKLPVAT
jgi:hypothetical protein